MSDFQDKKFKIFVIINHSILQHGVVKQKRRELSMQTSTSCNVLACKNEDIKMYEDGSRYFVIHVSSESFTQAPKEII